jgi:hypothetical protein
MQLQNKIHSNPGLREELEQEVESLMSAITAISSIHELSLHLWEGTHGHRSNHIILSSTRGRSTGPRLFVLPNLNTVLSHPHQMNIAVVVFWGMVRNRCGSHRTTE